MISEHPISIGFHRLTDCQWDPWDRGVTKATFVRLQYKKHFEKEKIKGPLEKEDWNRARVFVKFLKMFYDITLKFSESLHVTSIFFFFKELVAMQRTLQKMTNGGNKVIVVYAVQ